MLLLSTWTPALFVTFAYYHMSQPAATATFSFSMCYCYHGKPTVKHNKHTIDTLWGFFSLSHHYQIIFSLSFLSGRVCVCARVCMRMRVVYASVCGSSCCICVVLELVAYWSTIGLRYVQLLPLAFAWMVRNL